MENSSKISRLKPEMCGQAKKNLFPGLNGFDYVSLNLKKSDICLLLAKNRQHPVSIGNTWAEQKSDNVIVVYAFGFPCKSILSNSGFPDNPVTLGLRNPEHFVVQVCSSTENFRLELWSFLCQHAKLERENDRNYTTQSFFSAKMASITPLGPFF